MSVPHRDSPAPWKGLMPAKLHAVQPVDERPVDVTLMLRADIEKRDWAACHVNGDKSPRIDLPEKRHMRMWRR